MAAMPPYAGLDEVYHVARLAFVRAEGRSPTMVESSVPPYLARSIAADPHAAPAFCVVGPRWSEVVRSRPVMIDQPVDGPPYVTPNYESQQPPLYYSIAARLVPARSAMFELGMWRLMSVLFAIVVVVGTALIAQRWFGPAGILAGAIVLSLPTWHTLLVRASNDAFACALVTIAIVATVYEKALPELIAWPLAIAAKLYTWPMVVVLPLLWRTQRARRFRVVGVALGCLIAAAITMLDLSARTRNPFGDFGFDPSRSGLAARSIRVLDMLKITVASAIWSSGQHWDALTPLAMAIYMLPLVAAVVWFRGRPIAWLALGAFAIAQIVNAAAFARTAQAGLPAGGKEGWYWYALAPIVVPALLAPALKRVRALAWWLIGWDILITEVALFHDYSGASSPAHPTALFRWGPWHWPFTAHLDGIGVGPFAGAIVLLRIIYLAAFFALQSLTFHDRPHDLALPDS